MCPILYLEAVASRGAHIGRYHTCNKHPVVYRLTVHIGECCRVGDSGNIAGNISCNPPPHVGNTLKSSLRLSPGGETSCIQRDSYDEGIMGHAVCK